MFRGTTPPVSIHIKGRDLTGAKVYVTFAQGDSVEITRTDATVIPDNEDGCYVQLMLAQEETLAFSADKPMEIQVRTYDSGEAQACCVFKEPVCEILMDGVIPRSKDD